MSYLALVFAGAPISGPMGEGGPETWAACFDLCALGRAEPDDPIAKCMLAVPWPLLHKIIWGVSQDVSDVNANPVGWGNTACNRFGCGRADCLGVSNPTMCELCRAISWLHY